MFYQILKSIHHIVEKKDCPSVYPCICMPCVCTPLFSIYHCLGVGAFKYFIFIHLKAVCRTPSATPGLRLF